MAFKANFQEGHRRFGVLLRRLLSPFLQAKLSRLAACRGNVFFWGDLTRATSEACPQDGKLEPREFLNR